MGNYYEGDLFLYVDPESLKFSECFDLLKEYLIQCKEQKLVFSLRIIDENFVDFDDSNCFKDGNFEKTAQDVQKSRYKEELFEYDQRVEKGFDDIYDDEDVEFLEKIRNNEINFEDLTVDSIVIKCCSKKYDKENDEVKIIEIIEKLKPFKDKEEENYVGTIKDEDGYYRRTFWWDNDALNAEIKSREYLCEGCEYHKFREELCSRFKTCNRAFNLGQTTPHQDNDRLINALSFQNKLEEKIKRIENEDTQNGLLGALALLFEEPTITVNNSNSNM